ncbi:MULTISPECIES: D-alanyl-D-alanine carboxypeptidase family protein [Mesorhizobium]|uniref:D-alanyl-D-alanine carboxypeptidase n=1 Tax=Mesorhizobium denitrificans TaxID=2294114 RepID=A0A371XFU8_9HYPH|nr:MULTISPECIES: D-alanyl-D-alanine carboxypeptidase family protein [Mesorhizobium]RFC67904.1 D-alanyl-D-alanine carboxypeptidase [Mesorhizobium denitrificans]
MRPNSFLQSLLVGAALMVASPALANPTMLFDLQSGRVIHHQDAFQRWYPASLTKLMTAYVTFRALDAGELTLDSPIRISKNASSQIPAKMGYQPGSVVKLDNALKMMLVRSTNDIAMAIGENVGGTQELFVQRMNTEAARLGMTDTHYANPNGLFAPDQFTTARDQALLVTALRREFPQYSGYYGIEGLRAGKRVLTNFNLLVGRYNGADGMKTGFVCESGFNLIGSATRNGRTLVAIVLGAKDAQTRAVDAAALLDAGFANQSAGAQTVSALPFYGDAAREPISQRPIICPTPVKGQKQAQPSEQAEEKQESPFKKKLDHPPKLVDVGLGGATGPVPLASRGKSEEEVADVPIPSWRPDLPMPDGSGAAVQGDSGAAGDLRK